MQLETLPKDGADVAAVDTAKTDAAVEGRLRRRRARLRRYTSLEPGNYVVYSGVFTGKGAKGRRRRR